MSVLIFILVWVSTHLRLGGPLRSWRWCWVHQTCTFLEWIGVKNGCLWGSISRSIRMKLVSVLHTTCLWSHILAILKSIYLIRYQCSCHALVLCILPPWHGTASMELLNQAFSFAFLPQREQFLADLDQKDQTT